MPPYQSTPVQISNSFTHGMQFQSLQPLTGPQSVQHNPGTELHFVTGVVHIKTNHSVFCVIWEGWIGQNKPSTDSKYIIPHRQVLFDLHTDISCLPPTVPPLLVISQVSTSSCLISLITHTFIFLFPILINHHYTIN